MDDGDLPLLPVRRRHPVLLRDLEFLRANTGRAVKMTVPGPFTMSQQAQNDCYDSAAELAPDCGMKYLPREIADAKLAAMVPGAAMVREALAAGAAAL